MAVTFPEKNDLVNAAETLAQTDSPYFFPNIGVLGNTNPGFMNWTRIGCRPEP